MERCQKVIKTLTTDEVAWLFNTSSNTVRRWADEGILKAYRSRNRGDRRFKRENVACLLDEFGA